MNDLQKIADLVCESFGIEFSQLLKKSGQKRQIVEARRLYSYVAKSYTNDTWESIASYIGFNHSTSMFHFSKFKDYINEPTIYFGRSLLEHLDFVTSKLKISNESSKIKLLIYMNDSFINFEFTSSNMAEKWLFFLTEKNINAKIIKNEKSL